MNKNWWKSMLVVTIACLVICGIIKILFNIFPYLLLIALIIYVIVKIKGFIDSKKKVHNISENDCYTTPYSEDDENGKVIDVDYKEVK